MPRSKPKAKGGSPFFHSRAHILSDAAKGKLAEYLGTNPDDRSMVAVFNKIQGWLGLYVCSDEALRDEPRSSDYIAIFKPLRIMTFKLLKELTALNTYYREQLELKKVDIVEISKALCTLLDAFNFVIQDWEKYPSRGAPSNSNLMHVILNLRCTFRKYYQGELTGRKKRGASVSRSTEEKQEISFVKTALLDARIIPKTNKDCHKYIALLFTDSRCIPPTDFSKKRPSNRNK